LPESDEHFAYIVGYTEGGFPYGITWEEMREMEMAEKKHEAGKASNEPMELQPEPIVGFFARFGIPVEAKRLRGGVSIHTLPDRTPLARLVAEGKGDQVEILWWSHRDRWESIGEFGGVVMPLRKALQYIVDDEPGCFCGSIF
jgi:hypothetical protein